MNTSYFFCYTKEGFDKIFGKSAAAFPHDAFVANPS